MLRLKFFQDHAYLASLIRDDGIAFDLGFNNGAFSKHLHETYGIEIYAFEPLAHLCETATVPRGVCLHHAAIGGQDGIAKLSVFEGACASICRNTLPAKEREDVELLSLASAFGKARKFPIDLVKVDIEGSEFDMFIEAPIDVIQLASQYTVEFHDRFFEDGEQKVFRVVNKLHIAGFSCVHFSRSYTNTLFINRAKFRFPLLSTWWLGFPLKYGHGLLRLARRHRAVKRSG